MVYNANKTSEDYEQARIFLNPPPALVDTVHTHFPRIKALDEEMRSQDWSENEFDFSKSLPDFKNAPEDTSWMMLRTLGWQWEADSVASRSPVAAIISFNPVSELWFAELRITDNESVHAKTYSEIVRNGLPFPKEAIQEILDTLEANRRLDLVALTMNEVMDYAREVGYTQKWDEEKAMKYLILFYFTLLCLERIQFMASFAITFTIGKAGWFQEICNAVKKIAQDEFEIHCQFRKEVLFALQADLVGQHVFPQVKERLEALTREIIESEFAWTDWLFEGRSLLGTNAELVKQWVLFCAKDVIQTFNLSVDYDLPATNPMPHLEDWFNPNLLQPAPQEQTISNYRLNAVSKDDAGEVYDI